MSPRGKELNEEMRADALSRIESAALQVFAHYGYHGATMRQIAQAAGVSQGLLYHYHPSKADIFRHLVDSAFEESLEAMSLLLGAPGGVSGATARGNAPGAGLRRGSGDGPAGAQGTVAPTTAWQRIETYATMVVATLFEPKTSLRFAIMLQALTQGEGVPGLIDHIAQTTEAYYDLLVPLIEEAQRSGEAAPGDPRALAAAFFSFIQGLATLVFQRKGLEEGITPHMLVNVLR